MTSETLVCKFASIKHVTKDSKSQVDSGCLKSNRTRVQSQPFPNVFLSSGITRLGPDNLPADLNLFGVSAQLKLKLEVLTGALSGLNITARGKKVGRCFKEPA